MPTLIKLRPYRRNFLASGKNCMRRQKISGELAEAVRVRRGELAMVQREIDHDRMRDLQLVLAMA